MAEMVAVEDRDDKWEEEDWEEEEIGVQSLISQTPFGNIEKAIVNDANTFGFDIRPIASSLYNSVEDGDIAVIKLVNFVRASVLKAHGAGAEISASFVDSLKTSIEKREFLEGDEYMIPVLEDDSFFMLLQDELENVAFQDDQDEDANDEKVVRAKLARYENFVNQLTTDETTVDAEKNKDGYYYGSYSHLSIHETMLRDHARTQAYASALLENPDYVRGKVVLDVGCGTGILSMLAAKAGARKVIGIDNSSILHNARSIVEKNKLSSIVTLVHGTLEETELPLVEGEVDIIVSEWMGYALYYENMLRSVLFARDKYLKKDTGVLMPSVARIYLELATSESNDDRVSWWKDVYSFDMSELMQGITNEAQVQIIDARDSFSERMQVHTLDIGTAQDKDLDFTVPFSLDVTRDEVLKCFVVSFDVGFFKSGEKKIVLDTSPGSEPTHWKQTVLWIEEDKRAALKTGDIVTGSCTYERAEENERDYSITMDWEVNCKLGVRRSQKFILSS
jgi:predicted RNA methylase